jgi:hypothetical protein
MLRKLMPLVAVGMLLLGGCFDPDLANLLSAGAKLASNPSDAPIGDLTSAEILAISHNLPELAAQFPALGIPAEVVASAPDVTDEQAVAVVEFLDANNITTVSQLQALIVAVSNGETEVVVPESVTALLESLGYETDASALAAP